MASIPDFIDFICSAARLQRDYLTRNDTLRYLDEDRSRFVLYAVDTNIVMMFTNPATVGENANKSGRPVFGKIFPDDTETDQTAMSALLSNHVFYGMSDSFPLLQLPTQYQETQVIFERVARNARRRPSESSNLETQYELMREQLYQELGDTHKARIAEFSNVIMQKDAEERLENTIDELVKLVLGRGENYDRQYVSYLKLLFDGCLLPTFSFQKLLSEQGSYKGLAEVLDPPKTITEWFHDSERVDRWIEALARSKFTGRPMSIEVDARAEAPGGGRKRN